MKNLKIGLFAKANDSILISLFQILLIFIMVSMMTLISSHTTV